MNVTDIVSTLGFPIACCVAMGWYINKLQAQHKEEIKMLSEQHKDEVEKLTDVVNDVKLVVQKLVDILDRKE